MQSTTTGANSPFRKKTNGTTKRSPKLSKKILFKIQVWGFPSLPFELYSFSKALNKDSYLYGYKTYIDSDGDPSLTPITILDDNGFNAYYPRRISINQNKVLKGDDSWTRYMIARNIPDYNVTTEQTRQTGLKALQSYFMDPNYSKFPPESIVLVDETNQQNVQSMDNFLLNDDILTVMRDLIDGSLLNRNFYTDMNNLARAFFSGNPPIDAIVNYGFPNPAGPVPVPVRPVQQIPIVPIPVVPVVPLPPANAAWAPNVNLASQASTPRVKKPKKKYLPETVFGVSEKKIKGKVKLDEDDVDEKNEDDEEKEEEDSAGKKKTKTRKMTNRSKTMKKIWMIKTMTNPMMRMKKMM